MKIQTLIIALICLTPVFANYNLNIQLWENLNQTTLYINEGMICWAENSTTLYWGNYDSGNVNITLPTYNTTYDLDCCDNCYFVGTTLHKAPNTFQINPLDNNVSITGNTQLDYYVGEELRTYRTVLGYVSGNTTPEIVNTMEKLAGFVMILLSTIGMPIMILAFYSGINTALAIRVGGALGFIIGLVFAGYFSALSIPILSFIGILGLFFFIVILGGVK